MILALDAGNTSLKFGLFEKNQLIANGFLSNFENLADHLPQNCNIDKIGISSVVQKIPMEVLPNGDAVFINTQFNFPFEINYDSTETLGIDRLVACAGAYEPNTNYCVIDIGTCMTIDIVTKENGFIGGIISPGLRIRYKAMHTFTKKLPLISEYQKTEGNIGKNTIECMNAGAFNGMINEITGTIHALRSEYDNLKVYLTGGDSIFFEAHLKNGIFANQNLVLEGINKIIQINK